MKGLWERRARSAARFSSWIAGYLVYLELVSIKPALYTVQAMFPAAAGAGALARPWRPPQFQLQRCDRPLPVALLAAPFGGVLYLHP